MPGLKQLQQFNSDILNLGDESKLRAARGEKPVLVPIPKNVQDVDDSEDFISGLPVISDEEMAQAEAAAKEREKEANDFSDFMDNGSDESDEASEKPAQKTAVVPDVSDLLPSTGDMDLGDLDLSEFEPPPEPELEPEPEEIAIEDMDLDSLLAPAPKPEPEPEPEPEPQTVDMEASESIQDDFFDQDFTPSQDVSASVPKSEDSIGTSFDSSLFDMPQEESADEVEEAVPELDTESFASTFGSGSADDLPTVDDLPSDYSMNDLPPLEDLSFDIDADSTPAEEIPEISENTEISENPQISETESLEPETLPQSADFDPESQESETSLDDLDLPSFDNPNSDFETDSAALDMNDTIPSEFNETSEADLSKSEELPATDELSLDLPSLDDQAPASTDELSLDLPSLDDQTPASTDELSLDLPSLDDQAPATTDELSLDLPSLDDQAPASTDELSLDLPSLDDQTPASTDELSLDLPSLDDQTPASTDELSLDLPSLDDDSADMDFSAEASGIGDLDFSSEADNSDSDFALGDVDSDDFTIPGFSDTVTANLDKKPVVETLDFSKAQEPADDESNKPKNTFTDNEYKRFLKNLKDYPLNVRIALEDFVVKNEFTDDAIFGILEKVLRKAPARQVASELEKLLDIQLDVPRDFEKRSVAEYEAYKKSVEYQLKNRIIPGAILTGVAAVLIFCIVTLSKKFIYEPICASILYNQGYELLEDNQYAQSEETFNEALNYKPVKKWFFKYAEGYRRHKQYDRARMMYRAIVQRYDHDKKGALDWAGMECYDLYNYEESERLIKREVLDYYINDRDAVLQLGDVYLEWATDRDPTKFELAKEQYDLLVELYGTDDLINSRQMRYFIRTDNLRMVLGYKEMFMSKGRHLEPQDRIELSEYILDKRYGVLRPAEKELLSSIEDVRALLEGAVKAAPENPVALYNMARYFVNTNNGKGAAQMMKSAIAQFEKQTRRNKRETYKYINAYRLLGEEMVEEREYITAEELYGKGISIFEKENSTSGFESDENTGHLYSDLADLDYFIAGDNDAALKNYVNAVNNKYDTSSVRYRIGYIQYENHNYPEALGSFIKSQDTSGNDTHLLLALANTLSLSSDNHVAAGYYERLLSQLDSDRQKYAVLLPQVREDQADIVETYMKGSNNLGVTLSRIANLTGNSELNARAIVCLQESLRAWDALTRNQQTMIRLEGSNLAEQNIKYITHPTSDYEPEIYTQIPRTLYGEKGLE